MANTFKRYTGVGVTTTTAVHTVGANTTSTIIGLTVANTSVADITASVQLNSVYLVKDADIPVGSSLVVVGGDQKVVLEAADVVNVTSSGTTDVVISVLEMA